MCYSRTDNAMQITIKNSDGQSTENVLYRQSEIMHNCFVQCKEKGIQIGFHLIIPQYSPKPARKNRDESK